MLKHNLNKWPNNSDHYFSAFIYVTISEVNIKKKNLHEHGVAQHPLTNFVIAEKSQYFHVQK